MNLRVSFLAACIVASGCALAASAAGLTADDMMVRSVRDRSAVSPRARFSESTLQHGRDHAKKSRAEVLREVRAAAGRRCPAAGDLDFEPAVTAVDEQVEVAAFVRDGVEQRFSVRTTHGYSSAHSWTGTGLPAAAGLDAATNRLVRLFCKGALGRDYAIAGWQDVLSTAEVEVWGTLRHQEIDVPWDRFYLFLVDDKPGYNWGHECRYVLFSEDLTSYIVYFRQGPPEVRRKSDGSRVPIESLAGTRAFDRVSRPQVAQAMRAAVENVRASVTAAPKGDTSHTYCVLISGGADGTYNGSRFWSDTAAMYATLTLKYGIARDHIYTYLASGNSWAMDFYLNNYESFVAVPYDLDCDGNTDVNGGASRDNVRSLFTTTLKNKLTANDRLFVFITSHGNWDPAYSHDAYLSLFGDDYIEDYELSDWTKDLPCPVVFALEPCYSGGFIDDIVQTPNRAIATAADWNESSYWCDEGGSEWYEHTSPYGWTSARNEWARHLTAALRGVYPATENYSGGYPWSDSTIDASADGNGDGKVSFYEAAAFAQTHDIESEHPQYAESTVGLGNTFFLDGEGELPSGPANDNFAQAIALAGASGTLLASNVGATREIGEPAHAGAESSKTVWWKWTPTTSGTATFSTAGSFFDTVLAVYTGTSVASLDEIGSNDDVETGDRWSRVSFEAVAGTTYRIVVGGYHEAEGEITLDWESDPDPTPLVTTGTYYAQLTGINDFEYGWQISLSSCISDVNHMYEAATAYGNWLSANVTTLTDTAATKSAVRAGVQALAAKAVAGDTVLLYHSAHGSSTSVCCYDDGGSYTKDEIADDLGLFRSGVKVVVIVDACEAGGLFKSANGLSLGEEVRAIMREKQRQNGGTRGGINADEIGWITAVDEDNSALEDTFTPKLCEGWVDGSADSDDDGKINFYELYQYARDASVDYDCGYAQCCNEAVLKASWAREEGEAPVPPPPPQSPENDDFSDAEELNGAEGDVAADSSQATSESRDPVEGRTLWWRWTAPSDGTVTLKIEDCAFDPMVGVYTGDQLRDLDEVAVSKSGKVSFESEKGVEYHFVVAGRDEDEGGPFTLSWKMSIDEEQGGGGSGGGTGTGALPSLAVAADASYSGMDNGAYSGWLVNKKTKTFDGTFTVKAPKMKKDGTVKLTASVALRGQAKAQSFNGIGRIESDKKDKLDKLVAQLNGKNGVTLNLMLSANRVTGSLDGMYDVDGVSDVVNRQGAAAHQGDWVLSVHATPTVGEFSGFCGFAGKVSAKGTAKLSGTLPDGTKLSFTTRIISDGKATYLPVFGKAYSKKGDFGGLVIDMDKAKSSAKADGYWDGAAAKVPVQAKVSFVGFQRVGFSVPSTWSASQFGPAVPDKEKVKPPQKIGGFPVRDGCIPDKLALTFAGKKWDPLPNFSKLKLTYTPKTGVVKGAFTIETTGKKFKANVNGVWLVDRADCNASVKGVTGFGMRISRQ